MLEVTEKVSKKSGDMVRTKYCISVSAGLDFHVCNPSQLFSHCQLCQCCVLLLFLMNLDP